MKIDETFVPESFKGNNIIFKMVTKGRISTIDLERLYKGRIDKIRIL